MAHSATCFIYLSFIIFFTATNFLGSYMYFIPNIRVSPSLLRPHFKTVLLQPTKSCAYGRHHWPVNGPVLGLERLCNAPFSAS